MQRLYKLQTSVSKYR